MQIGIKANTNPGKVRKNNEDYFLVVPEYNLLIVADGMGGHNAGEIASNMTCTIIKEYFKENFELLEHSSPCSFIKKAIKVANRAVYQRAQKNKEERGMGTTIIVILMYDNKAYIGWVGDSRAYISRDENGKRFMSQITADHSLVQEQINENLLTREDADKYNIPDIITKAVGLKPDVEPDCNVIKKLKKDDIFMACSDGYYRYFLPKNIAEVFISTPFEDLGDSMIQSAYDAGGEDNITVGTIKIFDL